MSIDQRREQPTAQPRAEWLRAWGFVIATAGFATLALTDPEVNGTVWVVGSVVFAAGAVALVVAARAIPEVRRLFGSLVRLRFSDAWRATRDLNRIPPRPEPNRTPRIVARVFGPLSAAAAVAVLVRIGTM